MVYVSGVDFITAVDFILWLPFSSFLSFVISSALKLTLKCFIILVKFQVPKKSFLTRGRESF